MRARCLNPKSDSYKWYGAKGVTIDPTWDDFQVFKQDMGPRPPGTSLDRIDGTKGYCKENCKWSTEIEQQNNRSNNRNLTFNGKTQSASKWSRETGISHITLQKRLVDYGWSVERALAEPTRPYNRKTA